MIAELLLVICIIIIGILLVQLVKEKKQTLLANKIRAGYEKKCNSFKIRYEILNKLENEEAILEKVRLLNQKVYIYGGGIIGKKLEKILQKDEKLVLIGFLEKSVFENKNKQEVSLNLDAIIIVTPMFDYDSITELLLGFTTAQKIKGIDEIL